MKFIDKKNKRNAFVTNIVINTFIKEQKKRGNECKYFLLCKTPYKNILRNFLIKEQQEKCCYCMRKLKYDDTTTLEHIIPKGANHTEINGYLLAYKRIFTQIKHESNLRKFAYPPYPHQIAYGNLCASCKGILKENSLSSLCCNCKREHSTITPLIFIPNIERNIEYMKMSGEMILHITDSNRTLDKLGLNNAALKEIRMFWALIAKNKSMKFIKQNRKYDLLSVVFHVNNLQDLAKNGYGNFAKYFSTNEYYWNLLKDYKWFYFYYKKKK